MGKFFVEINRLRAIAVLLVLVDHFQSMVRYVVIQGRTIADFWVGVDLFLVISGFVVTSAFYTSYIKDGYNISIIYKFYYKRFYRIVPAMLMVLGVNVGLYYLLKSFGYVDSWALDSTSRLKGVASILSFTANLFYGQKDVLPPFDLGYFWSISLEWQFYCIFPLIIYFSLKNWRDRLLSLGSLLFLMIALRYNGIISSGLLRYDGFIIGVIIFFIDFSLRDKIGNVSRANFLNKLYLLILIWVLLIMPSILSGAILFTILAVLSGCVLYLCSLDAGYLSYGRYINTFLDYIGNRSYLIYLTHMTSFLIVRATCYFMHFDITVGGIKKTCFLLVLYLLIQVFIIELLAKYIEKPGINKSHNLKIN